MAEKRAGRRRQTTPLNDEPVLARDAEVRVGSSGGSYSAGSDDALVAGQRWHGVCPGVCGAAFDVKWTGEEFLVGSFSLRCPHGGECLRSLAAAAGTTAGRIKSDPLPYLTPWLESNGGRAQAMDPPPGEAIVAGWHSALLANRDALAYLTEQRGLTFDTIGRYELGYDGDRNAITFPARDEVGALINVKRRSLNPAARVKSRGLARPAALYPMRALAEDPPGLVVCEGEPDALLLNQHDIGAVTSTAGTHWNPAWHEHVAGRRVAVLYDAGALSYEKAEARAAEFRAAGTRDAWPVDLTLAGFHRGEDVTDWFVTYGWSADELRAYIWESRRWYRADRRAV